MDLLRRTAIPGGRKEDLWEPRSPSAIRISDSFSVLSNCFMPEPAGDEHYRSLILVATEELNGCHPPGSVLVVAFVPYAQEDSWRKNCLLQCLGAGRGSAGAGVMWFPRPPGRLAVVPFSLLLVVCSTIQQWLSAGSMHQHVLLVSDGGGGLAVLVLAMAAYQIYAGFCSSEVKALSAVLAQLPPSAAIPRIPCPSQRRYLSYLACQSLKLDWPPQERTILLGSIAMPVPPRLPRGMVFLPFFQVHCTDTSQPGQPLQLLWSQPAHKIVPLGAHGFNALQVDAGVHVNGDCLVECLHWDGAQAQRLFSVVFHTAFLRSTVAIFGRDDLDIEPGCSLDFADQFRLELLLGGSNTSVTGILGRSHEAGDVGISNRHLALALAEGEGDTQYDWSAVLAEGFELLDFSDDSPDVSPRALHKAQAVIVGEGDGQWYSGGPPIVVMQPQGGPAGQEDYEEPPLQVGKGLQHAVASQPPAPGSADSPAWSGPSLLQPHPGDAVAASVHHHPSSCAGRSPPPTSCPQSPGEQEEHTLTKRRSISADGTSIQLSDLEEMLALPHKPMADSPGKDLPIWFIHQRLLDHGTGDETPKGREYLHETCAVPEATNQGDQDTGSNGPHGMTVGGGQAHLDDPSNGMAASFWLGHEIWGPTTGTGGTSASLWGSSSLSLGLSSPIGRPLGGRRSLQVTSNSDRGSLFVGSRSQGLQHDPIRLSLDSLCLDGDPNVSQDHEPPRIARPPPPPRSAPPRKSLDPVLETALNGFSPLRDTAGGGSLSPHGPLRTPVRHSFDYHNLGGAGKAPALVPPPPPPPPPRTSFGGGPTVHVPPPPPPPRQQGLPQAASALGMHLPPPVPPPPPPPKPQATPLQPRGVSNPLGPVLPPPPPPQRTQFGMPGSVSAPVHPPPPPPALHRSQSTPLGPVLPPPPPPPRLSGGGGNPGGPSRPPPPPPGPPPSSAVSPIYKVVHWEKINSVQQGTLWADLSQSRISDSGARPLDLNVAELHDLFPASAPRLSPAVAHAPPAGPKPARLSMDLRRASNCEIMLAGLKMTVPEVISAIMAMDATKLGESAFEGLLQFVPTEEEEESLRSSEEDDALQCPAEELFKAAIRVPRYGHKLSCFSFRLQFDGQCGRLERDISTIVDSSRAIRQSVPLRRVLHACLSLGNTLNAGTARGGARGFRLSSLQRIASTKSQTTQMSLIEYLCKVLNDTYRDIFPSLHAVTGHLESGCSVILKTLGEEVSALQGGTRMAAQELKLCRDDAAVCGDSVPHAQFAAALEAFLADAEERSAQIACAYREMVEEAEEAVVYFGEDPMHYSYERVCRSLLEFVQLVLQSAARATGGGAAVLRGPYRPLGASMGSVPPHAGSASNQQQSRVGC